MRGGIVVFVTTTRGTFGFRQQIVVTTANMRGGIVVLITTTRGTFRFRQQIVATANMRGGIVVGCSTTRNTLGSFTCISPATHVVPGVVNIRGTAGGIG
jgi:hypothetical protein